MIIHPSRLFIIIHIINLPTFSLSLNMPNWTTLPLVVVYSEWMDPRSPATKANKYDYDGNKKEKNKK